MQPSQGREVVRIVALTVLSGVIVLLALTWLVGFAKGMKAGSTYSWSNAVLARPTPTPILPAYKTDVLTVSPDSYTTETITISRAPGTLEGYFLVGGGNSDITFSIQQPNGEYLFGPSMVQVRRTFDYTLTAAGIYILKWDNSFSLLTAKQVTLYWRAFGPEQ